MFLSPRSGLGLFVGSQRAPRPSSRLALPVPASHHYQVPTYSISLVIHRLCLSHERLNQCLLPLVMLRWMIASSCLWSSSKALPLALPCPALLSLSPALLWYLCLGPAPLASSPLPLVKPRWMIASCLCSSLALPCLFQPCYPFPQLCFGSSVRTLHAHCATIHSDHEAVVWDFATVS